MTTLEKIIKAWKKTNWTQAEWSRQSGVNRHHVNAIVNGRRNPGAEVTAKLAKAVGLEVTVKEKR